MVYVKYSEILYINLNASLKKVAFAVECFGSNFFFYFDFLLILEFFYYLP